MYIVLGIIAFGILIAIHELGHFLAAKAFRVKVNEFSIGMGPAIFKKQGKETLYSLRVLPIGGYCAMEGEDDDSDDPRSFGKQRRWKKLIILAAGAFMNFLLGFIIVLAIFSQAQAYGTNRVSGLAEGFPDMGETGLMAGDEIYSINGMRIYYSNDFSTAMARVGDRVNMVVIRNGEKVTLENYELVPREYEENGETVLRYVINFEVVKATFLEKIKYTVYTSFNFVRLIWYSLTDLFTGAVGIKDLSGPVGIVSVMNDMGAQAASTGEALLNIAYLCGFIAINLAVMNLLPIPALDGGRIFFLVITWIIEKIIRRKVNPKYDGYIHTAGFVLLMGLMIFVFASDVVKIING